jgi:lipopolysaccharide transport system ATP-binding protein
MNPILEIENISKRFRIAHELQPYLNIRDRVTQIFSSRKSSSSEEFWALKDISFDVAPGESIGIIGKNGAGKSTLLKILSKITPPTSGKIISRGRIASLLEVGTGFHPELTGRENIFLNGSILGMKRWEIEKKFDEIIDFAGVERFLDTPLKHYSSGMQLRLAFSVAAFLEPEVLIIDEVLAVGDMEFQKKCMGKMDEVSKSGRTILFVSHNMGAVSNLCTKAVLLRKGRIAMIDTSAKVVEQYLHDSVHISESRRKVIESVDKSFILTLPYWINESSQEIVSYPFASDYTLRFEFEFRRELSFLNVGLAVLSKDGSRIFTSHSIDDKSFNPRQKFTGHITFDAHLDLKTLAPGNYQVVFGVADERGTSLIPVSGEVEVILEITELQKIKDGADGILWHTGTWNVSKQNQLT